MKDVPTIVPESAKQSTATEPAGPPLNSSGLPACPTTQGKYVLTLYVEADSSTPGPVWEKPSEAV